MKNSLQTILVHSLKLVSLVVLLLLFFLLIPNISISGDSASIDANPDFKKGFNNYYAYHSETGIDILLEELFDRIESVLITGSHVTQVDRGYRIRAIQQNIFEALKGQVCPKIPVKVFSLKYASVQSISSAAKQDNTVLWEIHYGEISGILVRILERASKKICGVSSFERLKE